MLSVPAVIGGVLVMLGAARGDMWEQRSETDPPRYYKWKAGSSSPPLHGQILLSPQPPAHGASGLARRELSAPAAATAASLVNGISKNE